MVTWISAFSVDAGTSVGAASGHRSAGRQYLERRIFRYGTVAELSAYE